MNLADLVADAKKAADELRRALELGDAPVPDIIPVLERVGLTVFIEALGRGGPWGAFVPLEHSKIVILNGSLDLPWLRTTAAHELGHCAFNDGLKLDRLDDVKVDGPVQRPSPSDLERRANVFARYFLMPEAHLRAELQSRDGLDANAIGELAQAYGTTPVQVARHLETLGIIDATQRRALIARPETIALEQREPGGARRLPTDYVERAFRAYRTSRVSFGRLAELLYLEGAEDLQALREMLREYRSLHDEDMPREEAAERVAS